MAKPIDPTEIIARLQAVADGRREYAAGMAGVDLLKDQYDALMTQANAFDLAVKIAKGDLSPLYGLLPTWRWTDEMDSALKGGQ